MLVGVPKKIKSHEYRVGLTPASVCELRARGAGDLHLSAPGTRPGAGAPVAAALDLPFSAPAAHLA